ncbi:related to YIA6 - Pvruvate transporter of the mitochondrial inner membrane [Ustilago trichophora]|uniref:Related to YIA6 - Pvruvate transporter of the mitochondrial inner membrane n=1 Tax=Ustilago trichophora TaxID=86804 RepID=A0A5C3E0F3_9BASI|nr:related to YIA6 - Pvruvate transporter of the mitochondrial inner membrane [Ustilago trichophora]
MLHSSAIAGACAGLVSSVVTCPLDVVKTRLQAQEGRRRPPSSFSPNPSLSTATASPSSTSIPSSTVPASPRYLGLRGTLAKIYRDDGLRGFYRGLGPTIFGYLPTWAIYFTVYDNCKDTLSALHHQSKANSYYSQDFLIHILSAMTAGAASTICTSPLWVVKTRFMLQSAKDTGGVKPYRHTGDAFVQIYRSEGLRGFYKGLLPSLFGVSHVAVQFPLYEAFKGIARRRKENGTEGGEEGEGELEAWTILLCSSTAKMIASVTTYPHEVLRTRLQMQPRNKASSPSTTASTTASAASSSSTSRTTGPSPPFSPLSPAPPAAAAAAEGGGGGGGGSGGGGRYTGVIQATRTIAREEGIRGFYKGMTVNLIRTVPSSALTILTYELIMQHLSHPHDSLHDSHDDGGETRSD